MPSTVIKAATYRPETGVLDVLFVSGRRYRYHDVPPAIAEGFARAGSKGSYFNGRIRDRFRFTAMEAAD